MIKNRLKYFQRMLALLDFKERRRFKVIVALLAFAAFLDMLGIGVLYPLALLVTQPEEVHAGKMAWLLETLNFLSPHTQIIALIVFIFSIFMFKTTYMSLLLVVQARLVTNFEAQLSSRLCKRYLDQPWTFHMRTNSSELLNRVSLEAGNMSEHGILSLLNLSSDLLVILILSGLLFYIEPFGMLIVSVVFVPFAVLWQVMLKPYMQRWGAALSMHDRERIKHFKQSMAALKEVRLYGQERYFATKYERHCISGQVVKKRHLIVTGLPRLWLELLTVSGVCGAFLVFLLFAKEPSVILPLLGVMVGAAFRVVPALNRILNALNNLSYLAPVCDAMSRDLQLPVMPPRPVPEPALEFNGELSLEAVSFTYPEAPRRALDEIALRIAKNSFVGVIGTSGAGKSTLVDVLLGLLEVDSGTIHVSGRPLVNEDDWRAWQRLIGYVPQSMALLDDTLRENIVYGREDECEDSEIALAAAVEDAQLHALIETLPAGLETLVGENGVRLSGGQRQRIGIARALYCQPQVLILDEATSALDTHHERSILRCILAMKGSRTVIFVSHRLSTLQACDQVIWLHEGRVFAQGDAAEIISSFKQRELFMSASRSLPDSQLQSPATDIVSPLI